MMIYTLWLYSIIILCLKVYACAGSPQNIKQWFVLLTNINHYIDKYNSSNSYIIFLCYLNKVGVPH